MVAAVLVVAAMVVARGRTARRALAGAGACLASSIVAGAVPVVAVGATIALVLGLTRAHRRRRWSRDRSEDEHHAIDMLTLAVGAGLTFAQAVRFAAIGVGGGARVDLEMRLRRFDAATPGRDDGGDHPFDTVFSAARRSTITGSPLHPSLHSVARALRRARTERERARLARLPVKLLFPLSLLILPGFVLLVVGPAVVSGLDRLSL